jgi:hypothetical protein
MKKVTLLLCTALFYASAFAQTSTSILTIFSEDGHRFFLILNGQRQNEEPETNIRIEHLAQPYYNAKVIFDDKTLGEISKNIQLNNADNLPGDVTYKIKAGKDGKQVLRFYSARPITADAPGVRPEGVPVYDYGVARPIETTTTTKVTTTVITNDNINGNISTSDMTVNIPHVAVVEKTTTTTTTSTASSNLPPTGTSASGSACNGYAMAPGDYQSAKSTITSANFEESKLNTAKEIAGSNCLYAAQVAEICRLFGFEESKLTFAKYAYSRCIDPQNYFKVNNVFDFDASKTELSKYTGH